MKSTIRIKKINGKEYWYEDIPYYDKEKKQIRHKSKYLGKNIDGQPVKVRSDDMIPARMSVSSAPKAAYNHGNLLPLQSITQELSIQATLEEFLSESETDTLLALVYNRILRPTAMTNVQTWYEGSSLWLSNNKLPLSGQRISEFLANLGQKNIPEEFMSRFAAHIEPDATLLYDITSLSSSSKLLECLEYGYNRDNDGLPQINFSLVVDKDKGIPVRYDLYPGSIADITTLKNTIIRLKDTGSEQFRLIMDRGFFSQTTLVELLNENIPFILPATYQLTSIKELMSKSQNKVKQAQYLQKLEKGPIFAMPVKLEHQFDLEDRPRIITVNGYCYYDPKREQDERDSFYVQLFDAVERLKKARPQNWKRPEVVVKEITKGFARFLNWKFIDGKFEVSIKQKAVTQRMNRLGRFILFYNGDLDWLSCLTLYRQRDAVEKCFLRMKNDLDTLPLNAKRDDSVKGYLFMVFIALIIRMRLQTMLKETGLSKQYSVEKLLLELEKIKLFVLSQGQILQSEVSKKNREILTSLNLCA
ncbi:IS1634 family transposase [Methanospirillum sp. J.3.6.1-F.2.7.3]|jgi:transposase|uniref:IS1634 family transposase n=1 Tax=Methanospirillum purgamenti TaxID=2834276 RepID=A0A8E7B151_9EURY|nr:MULTISPECIES: IS1634 family transposase [Methanospirillum]MDX8551258.1 IS1634 family transposase [Methanospirillum hungatei]QVV88401.1 IS1634 family transposase [Methanospirillum sp. J.3.6.1-F.2.7.3]